MPSPPAPQRLPIIKRLYPSLAKRLAPLVTLDGFRLQRFEGARFLLQSANYVDRQIALYGGFENAQRAFLFETMAARGGCDVFLDIGANFGLYSVLAAKRGLSPRVIAFEPDERNALQLSANLFLNDLAGKVELVRAAVTAESGFIAFAPASAASTGQSRIAREGEAASRVRALALDDFLPLTGQRIAAKIDIEGHEAEALRGMSRLIRENQVVLQVESFHPDRITPQLTRLGLTPLRQIDHDHFFGPA